MIEKLGVAKAARLLGVSRSHLQKLIKNGELNTFEGYLRYEDLKNLFPQLAVDNESMHREVDLIKKAAFSNRLQDLLIPSVDNLTEQLSSMKVKFLVEQQKATYYHEVLMQYLKYMSEVRVESDVTEKQLIDQLSNWLLKKLDESEV